MNVDGGPATDGGGLFIDEDGGIFLDPDAGTACAPVSCAPGYHCCQSGTSTQSCIPLKVACPP